MKGRGILFGMIMAMIISCSDPAMNSPAISGEDLEDYTSVVMNSQDYFEHAAALGRLEAEEAATMNAIRDLQLAGNESSNDEPFIFFVIGDSELLMRGNTYPQLQNWIDRINNIEDYELEFVSGDFDEDESSLITKPEIVLLAGDINKDRAFGFSLPGDANDVANRETYRLFNEFDDDILFLAGNGNHDWDPYRWGDGNYGHNFGGLLSNLGTAQFVRSWYYRSLNSSDFVTDNSINYDRHVSWFQPTTSAEFNYSLVYRGVRFTQLNQFLYQPAAMVSFESIFGSGPAWYFQTRAGQWFQNMCDNSAEELTPHVVVQHFPVYTGDGWWNDDLGSSADQLRKRYMDIFEDSHEPVMFSGHNHSRRTTTVQPYGIIDNTSGYFANGHIIAVKASASKGIYAISHVDLNALTTSAPDNYSTSFNIPQ